MAYCTDFDNTRIRRYRGQAKPYAADNTIYLFHLISTLYCTLKVTM